MKSRLFILSLLIILCVSSYAQTPSGKILEQQVRGNAHVSVDAILAATQLKPGVVYSADLAKQDKDAIMSLGLFQGVMPRAVQSDDGVIIIYEVEENPFLEKIEVSGNTVITTDEILKVMQNKTNQVLNTNYLRSDIIAIRTQYRSKGYVFIGIPTFEPDPNNNSVLKLEIIESKIAKINIIGNKHTKAHVIREQIYSQEGSVFNVNKWSDDLSRVFNLNYFEDVTTSDEPRWVNDDSSKLELDIIVKEKRTGMLNVGFGYDQRQGLFGMLDVQDPNFRGEGQSVSASYQRTSEGKDTIELGFSDAVIDAKRTGFSVRLYSRAYTRFSNSTFGSSDDLGTEFDERRQGGEISIGRPLAEKLRGFVSLRVESINSDVTEDPEATNYILQDGNLYSLSFSAIHNTRDMDFNPAKGHYYKAGLEFGLNKIDKLGGLFTDPDLLGEHEFYNFTLDARHYWSLEGPRKKLTDTKKVIATRFYYSQVFGTVPFWEQVFVGGSETLRGYAEDRFWGKQGFSASAELRIPIASSLSMVAFIDCGDAWGGYGAINNYTQDETISPKLGYGLGMHFQTPFGPLRLDFGFNEEGGSRTHVRVGHAF